MQEDHYDLDAALADSHWWWVARRKLIGHLMDRLLRPDPSRRILEVGCSTGSNIPLLQRFGQVDAMEMHPRTAALTRRRFPEMRIYDGGIPDPLRDTFDVICLFDVLEHIEDDAGALEWIDDHLAPNGTLLITVPAYRFLWSRHDDLAHHFRRYTRPQLADLLQERFELSYTSYFNTHLFPAIAAIRLLQRLLRLNSGENDKAVGGRGVAHRVLEAVFAAERVWLPALRLPFGVSIIAAARKAPPA